jgi:hypothetical protein
MFVRGIADANVISLNATRALGIRDIVNVEDVKLGKSGLLSLLVRFAIKYLLYIHSTKNKFRQLFFLRQYRVLHGRGTNDLLLLSLPSSHQKNISRYIFPKFSCS